MKTTQVFHIVSFVVVTAGTLTLTFGLRKYDHKVTSSCFQESIGDICILLLSRRRTRLVGESNSAYTTPVHSAVN